MHYQRINKYISQNHDSSSNSSRISALLSDLTASTTSKNNGLELKFAE
jgi:hypothetical protein